ncbi:neuropeptide receptor 15-like [Babylonia areolata]|uniref:neuropeptide receptor 15-like n=1 Tax=Babylonia areolata TaxID=304850 RepID=UPI003FD36E6D
MLVSAPASVPEIVLFSLLFLVIGTVGIVGNALVIYAVVCDRKMRSSVTNLLITNLALADLVIMVFGIPEIVQVMINQGWVLGPTLCKANRFVLVLSLYASVLTLVSICVERYIGIIHPIRAHILCNRRRIGLVIGVVWPVALLAGAPTLLFNQVRAGHGPQGSPVTYYCLLQFPGERHAFFLRVFKYAELGLFYVAPLIVQVALYAIVSRQLFTGSEKLHRRLTVLDENGLARERTSEAVQARKGVVKMLMVSVIIFFLSYCPQHVLLVYDTLKGSPLHEKWVVHVLTMIVAYTNSATNPILYSIFSQNFRKNFRRALCGCRRSGRGRQARRKKPKPDPRRHSTLSTSSRLGRLTSLVPSANTDL